MKMQKGKRIFSPGVVPLVLHKIVRSEPTEWEDVQLKHLREILDVIGQNGASEMERWALTFDDGHLSDYEIVFPQLVERNIKATFFLATDLIGTPGYVHWPHVAEMHKAGMGIGSHSCSHPTMSKLPISEATREFKDSKKILEDFLGESVNSFSYPFGDCSTRLHKLGLSVGYKHLYTSNHGFISSDVAIVPRNSINSAMGWEKIYKVMNPSYVTRMNWLIEDKVKTATKEIFGVERYVSVRNFLLGPLSEK